MTEVLEYLKELRERVVQDNGKQFYCRDAGCVTDVYFAVLNLLDREITEMEKKEDV